MFKKKIRIDIFFIAGLLASVLPFIILSFFNHPQNDDYVEASWAKAYGSVEAIIRWYNIWSARYFATAVTSSILNPLVLGSFFIYKFTAALTIFLLVGSLYFFLSELTAHSVSVEKRILFTLAVSALYLFQMPNIAESLYWITGAVCYQYAIIFLLATLGLIIRLYHASKSHSHPLLSISTIILLFLTAGTNEIAVVLQCELVALILLTDIVSRRKKINLLSLFFATSLAGFAIVFFAPGTQARNSYGKHDLWFAVQSSAQYGSKYLIQWLTTTPLVPLTVFFVHFIAKHTKTVFSFIVHPALSLSIFFLTYFGMFIPSFYGVGMLEPHTVSIIYFFFLIGFFINVYLCIHYFYIRKRNIFPALNSYGLAIVGVLAVILSVAPGSNLKTAYSDLFSGAAYRYDQELNKRYDLIAECKTSLCDVPPLTDHPRTIFWFEDAVDEKEDSAFFLQYKDHGYAFYFDKQRIRLTMPSPGEIKPGAP